MVDEVTEKFLWVEKYRPKVLDDVVLPKTYRDIFEKYIQNKNIPHLLFYGGPGSGKTTVARILINNICESKLDLLALNGSSANSVDIIRNMVEDFVSTSSNSGKIKIVYYDEADYITHNAQAALRNIIEAFHENARFIFTCNYISKINDAIQSRCQTYEFKQLPKEYIKDHVIKILNEENIEYNEGAVTNIISSFYPDIRRIVGLLQSRVNDGKLFIDNIENSNEHKIIILISDIGKSFSNKKTMKEKIDSIQEIISNYEVDYKTIYQKAFENSEIPIWVKIVLNEYANKHEFCMLPSMNFMSCLYQIMQNGNELSKALR